MLRSKAIAAGVCWQRSVTTEVQRLWSWRYPVVDFDFWAKYGSWSQCPACGVCHFNDEYFRQVVFQQLLL